MNTITPEDAGAIRMSAETGLWHLRGFLTREQQDQLVAAARGLKAIAPMVQPTMRDGTPMSVRVSSFGRRGWWSDSKGYWYVDQHPTTGRPWPPLPVEIWGASVQSLMWAGHLARQVRPDFTTEEWTPGGTSAWGDRIDTCLVNYYAHDARLGWHVDQTEKDRHSPIVTFSVGASAVFMVRVEHRGELVTQSHILRSGDVIVMAGKARLAEHCVHSIEIDDQSQLFADNYNPIRESRSRLSFTVRSTGL